MNFGEREKANYCQNRRGSMENQQDAVRRKKSRAPHFFGQMDKNYPTDQMPYDTEVYKPRIYPVTTKMSGYPQVQSNDDLYRKIRNTSTGTHEKPSADKLPVPRKDVIRRRGGRDVLSLIPDEEEEDELSDQDEQSRLKYFEDEEADDEVDYESDPYDFEPLEKNYPRFARKPQKFDRCQLEQCQEWLSRNNRRSPADLEKSANQPKYNRVNRKLAPKCVQDTGEQRKRAQVQRCSDCGKIMESAIKPTASRNDRSMLYDYSDYQRNFAGDKQQRFDEQQDDLPCPKPRKSKTAPRSRDVRKLAINQPKLENYYEN